MSKFYQKPKLPYDYNALEPFISEELLKLHYDKHHQAYVDGANNLLKKLTQARESDEILNMRDTIKHLSYHIGGHHLHSLFWGTMISPKKSGKPKGELKRILKEEFGSIGRFKKEFEETANSVEGSGWAALAFCRQTNRSLLMQIEKHNLNIYPELQILMVLDVWEHAYYKDYENNRGDFVSQFWTVVNWERVAERLG